MTQLVRYAPSNTTYCPRHYLVVDDKACTACESEERDADVPASSGPDNSVRDRGVYEYKAGTDGKQRPKVVTRN